MHTYVSVYWVVIDDKNIVYKIPTGSVTTATGTKSPFICLNTFFFYTNVKFYSNLNPVFYNSSCEVVYKPFNKIIYYSKLQYIGKGFKLIFKKKKYFFNCIFGHSHIYWVKLQSIIMKRTKKYKLSFMTNEKDKFEKTISILKKIKPMNRYTLRGVRTYTHKWVKIKGRKSVATHF